MAYPAQQPVFVTTQPIMGNPFQPFNDEWRVGLFNCCDNVSQCCYAHCCWCCFLCTLEGKIGETKGCCIPNALAVYRMKVRSVLRIRGSAFGDCCAVCWCPMCVGLQMRNELINRGLG